MNAMKTRKLTLTAIFIAINIVLSSIIVIPLRPIKAAPIQHLINVLCAVFVGPWFGLAQAFISSILRMLFGTGSFFAFPGSMVGVLLASGFYYYRKDLFMAASGEVIGSGMIGSIMCVPYGWMLAFTNVAVQPLMVSFISVSVLGAIISYIICMTMKRKGILSRFL